MPSLTAKRRSQLLNALLQQSTTPQTGNRTGVEALMRVASQFVNKQHMDKLAEQERLDQQKLTDALVQQGFIGSPGGGASLETQGEAIMGDTGDPLTVTQKQRGTKPGVTGMKPPEEALTEILGLPQGVREQGIGLLGAIQQMQPKPEEAPDMKSGTGFGQATETITDAEVRTRSGTHEIYSNQFRSSTQRTKDDTDLGGGAQDRVASEIAQLRGDMDRVGKLKKMDPEQFLTLMGKGKGFAAEIADRFGSDNAAVEKYLFDFQTFKSLTAQVFQGIRREVTGAQAAHIELKVLEQAFLSNRMSPTQYKAALELIDDMQRNILETKQRLLKEGKDPNSIIFEQLMDVEFDRQFAGKVESIVTGDNIDSNEIKTESGATIVFED